MGLRNAAAHAMKLPVHDPGAAYYCCGLPRIRQQSSRMGCQNPVCHSRRDRPAGSRLPGKRSHCSPSNRGDGSHQWTRSRIAEESTGQLRNASREPRRDAGKGFRRARQQSASKLRESLSAELGHQWKSFCRQHGDERKKTFGGLFFTFSFRCCETHMLQHRIGVPLAHRTDLAFVQFVRLEFRCHLVLVLMGELRQGFQFKFRHRDCHRCSFLIASVSYRSATDLNL
jgi:hypothetical protein